MITGEQYTAGQIIKETLEYDREFIKSHYKYIKNITYGFIPKEESAEEIVNDIIIMDKCKKLGIEQIISFNEWIVTLDQELEDSRRFLE